MGAAFRCQLKDYDSSTAFEKIGHLIAAGAEAGFSSHRHKQTDAWKVELQTLAEMVAKLRATAPGSDHWTLLLEYELPRREKRPDAVLLAGRVVFVVEFKVGEVGFGAADEWQTYSYALDLRDFHAGCRGRAIISVLVATEASLAADGGSRLVREGAGGGVWPVQRTNASELACCIAAAYAASGCDGVAPMEPKEWEHALYRPTPTIIEAAEQLFAGHSVAEISHAFATNLALTSAEIVRAVESSQTQGIRTICFVTGIPGAGKTLAGLNAVHDPSLRSAGRPPAIFLSGNGPLVKVVREALIRDKQRSGTPRREAARVVSTFIANVHQFITHYGLRETSHPPAEHAIVFDEAQRAWTADAVLKKHSINRSEPQLILDIMERAESWCAVIALVGSGQEIYQGEAGLAAWGQALNSREVPWRVIAAPAVLRAGERATAVKLFESPPLPHLDVVAEPALHLSVSTRSPRAKLLGDWVDGILEQRPPLGGIMAGEGAEFPIGITRELDVARRWLRERSDVQQRCGLLASSGDLRLRAHGLELSSGFRRAYPYEDWFLGGADDVRSSRMLEVAATEFECQGLEIDWAGVCWGADFAIDPVKGIWMYRKFRGAKWQRVGQASERRYIANKYRVLLTRSRRGMVIWVPRGCSSDPTRDRHLLDATAEYLVRSGISAL